MTKTTKKTKVYECAHYEYEYDDLGKYCWCRNRAMQKSECDAEFIYCQRFCPGFKKGKYRGMWEISPVEKGKAEKFKKEIAEKLKILEANERAQLKYLKEKYHA